MCMHMHVGVCVCFHFSRVIHLVLLEEGLSLSSGASAGYPVNFRDQSVFASLVLGSSVLPTIPALTWVAGIKGAYASGPHALCSEHFAD